MKDMELRVRRVQAQVPQWWAVVPDGEKAVIRGLIRMLRGARRSQVPGVAQAARRWESGLVCFIKARLMNRRFHRRFKCGTRSAGCGIVAADREPSAEATSTSRPGACPTGTATSCR